MSSHTSRLGQTISRYNNAEGTESGPNNVGQTTTGSHANPPPSSYHNHKGHRRGHSYGGPITQTSYHSPLEARPSHPNAHHGTTHLPQHGTSVLQKGHRRALSGCLPMVGMGAVAWSSLRELENTSFVSPKNESRPSSPDNIVVADGRANLKITPMIPSSAILKDNYDLECGIGPCHLPPCFQGLANIKFFVTILALLVTLQQAVASGYVNSVITTIEARFEIPSRFMGIVASAYEMGNVVTVLFVSYLGAKRHIPRWIATGVLVMVVGCIMFTLPHFLAHDYNQGNRAEISASSSSVPSKSGMESSLAESGVKSFSMSNRGGRNSVCKTAHPQSSKFWAPSDSLSTTTTGSANNRLGHQAENDSFTFDGMVKPDDPTVTKEEIPSRSSFSAGCSIELVEENGKKTTRHTEDSYAQPFILFMIAQLLLGCGGSPLFTLGVTYVDDHVPAESSSVYIGVVYAMAAFGPVLGFLTGAWLLSIPDYTTDINPDANGIVGLWWGGFLIVGVLLFVVCLPFFTFPKIMASPKDEGVSLAKDYVIEENNIEGSSLTQLNEGYGQSLRDIPRSIWRLITNPTYVVTCLGGCMELNIVSGFVVFLPKYLETQFSLGKSDANLYVGGLAIPGACLGIFAGGFIMKKLQLKPSGAAKFVVMTNLLCLVGYALFFFLGCENPKLAGATVPYPGTINPSDLRPWDVNLTSECNAGCSCDSSLDAQFVCHAGTTFFSPCHAGCSVNNSMCQCAQGENVVPGKCPNNQCHTLEAFMVILFFMTGTVAVTQMPLLMIVMRSVAVEERSFALGMQFVIFRLFGYIPSPIIFGNVIDSACLLWSRKKCSTILPAIKGRCLLYDVQDFRYKYVGVLSGLKLLALALFLYDYFQLRNIEKKEEKESLAAAVALQQENLKLKSNSVISLDKLFEEVDPGNGSATTSAGP